MKRNMYIYEWLRIYLVNVYGMNSSTAKLLSLRLLVLTVTSQHIFKEPKDD